MSKKKTVYGRCDRCAVHFLTSYLPKHPADCAETAEVPRIQNGQIFGTSIKLEKRKEQLPSSALGWHRSHTVLVNPQALQLAGILPRTGCFMRANDSESLVVLWPSAEVSFSLMANVLGSRTSRQCCRRSTGEVR